MKDKAVLVAAASSGIGLATAEAFMAEGAKISICSHNSDKLKAAAGMLEKKTGRRPHSAVCDLTSETSIESWVKEAEKAHGPADVLVTNTGGPPAGVWSELKPEDWEKAHALVLKSVLKLAQLVIPAMQKTGWGRLVFISSLSAKQPITNLASSSTFRAGLLGFAKALSNDVGKYGITVNTVLPGYTLTNRQKELTKLAADKSGRTPEEIIKSWEKDIPLGRTASPEEIAAAVVFLASEKASYITGAALPVDGGITQSVY